MNVEYQGQLADLFQIDTRHMTDDQIRRIMSANDIDVLRMSGSTHYLSIVEATRRLRVAVAREESAIKWLTWVLVGCTIALLALGVIEYHERHNAPPPPAPTIAHESPGSQGSTLLE
jgi:hypothetical protein